MVKCTLLFVLICFPHVIRAPELVRPHHEPPRQNCLWFEVPVFMKENNSRELDAFRSHSVDLLVQLTAIVSQGHTGCVVRCVPVRTNRPCFIICVAAPIDLCRDTTPDASCVQQPQTHIKFGTKDSTCGTSSLTSLCQRGRRFHVKRVKIEGQI